MDSVMFIRGMYWPKDTFSKGFLFLFEFNSVSFSFCATTNTVTFSKPILSAYPVLQSPSPH